MKKLLEAAVLAGVLLLASGCGSAEVPENKETYAYASYAHPEMVGAIDVSSILSVAVNRPGEVGECPTILKRIRRRFIARGKSRRAIKQ